MGVGNSTFHRMGKFSFRRLGNSGFREVGISLFPQMGKKTFQSVGKYPCHLQQLHSWVSGSVDTQEQAIKDRSVYIRQIVCLIKVPNSYHGSIKLPKI